MKRGQTGEKRLFDSLDREFLRESFKQSIAEYRDKIGLPSGGFGSNEEYQEWLKHEPSKYLDISSAAWKISHQFKIPLFHSVFVEGYLLLDEKYKEFEHKVPHNNTFSRGFDIIGYACGLQFDEDYNCINVRILPGASFREITKFLRENKKEIEDFLLPLNRKVKPIRARRQENRDNEIYDLYKKGWLSRYGEDTSPDDILLPEKITKMDMDIRRKIIGEQIKARK